jgi:heterodisulfide reductase subunit B
MMNHSELIDVSYFPGCSLATTAKENNQSLKQVCTHLGYRLVELPDWNCCGSSSAHSVHADLAFHLACRNLSLAPLGRPLVVACPSCLLRLRLAFHRLKTEPEARIQYERRWGRPVDPDLEIVHFFKLLADANQKGTFPEPVLNGLKFAPYYGCMLANPPQLRHEPNYAALMERILRNLGAEAVRWSMGNKCCGTFLSVARPDIAGPMINQIMQGAVDAGAECLVTACAMCHMNLEIRVSLKRKLPIFHFSELLAMAYQTRVDNRWFARHLIDPVPLLKDRHLVA